MESGSLVFLKSAGQFLEKAAEQIREAAKERSVLSEATRESANVEIARIRLRLSLMRRDLAIVAAVANRRVRRER